MEWKLAKSEEFVKMAKEEGVCIVPVACLERHGDHMPLGTDGLIAEKIAVEAAKREPCMVFPTLYFGAQIHEATCFPGAVAIDDEICFALWDNICREISRNGFKKILFLNAHGGNAPMLDHYALSRVDRKNDYTFYWTHYMEPGASGNNDDINEIENIYDEVWGHACQWECDLVMSAAPGSVDLSLIKSTDTIRPLGRSKHLGRLHTGYSWYSDYPDHQVGTPSCATKEKGDKMIKIYIERLVNDIKAIKTDNIIPKLHMEFLERKSKVGRFDEQY